MKTRTIYEPSLYDMLMLRREFEEKLAEHEATMMSQGLATKADREDYEYMKEQIRRLNQKIDRETR